MSLFSIALTSNANGQDNRRDDVFLPLRPEGTRVFRFADDTAVVIARHWVAWEPSVSKWVPVWGYDQNDTRLRRPIITAVKRGDRWSGGLNSNPFIVAVMKMDLPETVLEKALQPEFQTMFSVIDITRVSEVQVDGEKRSFIYPDLRGNLPPTATNIRNRNEPAVLALKGIPSIKNGVVVGKSMVNDLYRALLDAMETDPITGTQKSIDPLSLVVVMKRSGQGLQTVTRFSVSVTTEPLPIDLKYDLTSWPKPMPEQAVAELLDGADYAAVVEKYNIKQYPDLISADLF